MGVGDFGEDLAVHDGVGAGFVGGAALDLDVFGEVEGPVPEGDREDRGGERGGDLVEGG